MGRKLPAKGLMLSVPLWAAMLAEGVAFCSGDLSWRVLGGQGGKANSAIWEYRLARISELMGPCTALFPLEAIADGPCIYPAVWRDLLGGRACYYLPANSDHTLQQRLDRTALLPCLVRLIRLDGWPAWLNRGQIPGESGSLVPAAFAQGFPAGPGFSPLCRRDCGGLPWRRNSDWFGPSATFSDVISPFSLATIGTVESAHRSEEIPINPLDFRTDLALWTGVVFLVLLAILGPLAWSPIARALDRREQHLEEQFAAAERRLAEAQALLEQYRQKLDQAAAEAQVILGQARAEAERQAATILAQAQAEAEAEHRRRLTEIQQAAEEAKRLLVQHAAKMAVTIAERVLEAQLDPLTQRKLLDRALNQLLESDPHFQGISGADGRGSTPQN